MTTLTEPATRTRVRDARTYFRTTLAIVAPVPFVAAGLKYLLLDIPGDGTFPEVVRAVARQSGAVNASLWLDAVFFATLIPAVIAIASLTHRRLPRVTAVAATLTIPGFAMAFGLNANDTLLAQITHDKHLDVATIGSVDTAWQNLPVAGVASLLFIVGIVFGLGMLGFALWRGRSVPMWAGLAVMIGGATHPFLPGHVAQGVGLFAAALGACAVSVALLRLHNDDFAPAPQQGVRK